MFAGSSEGSLIQARSLIRVDVQDAVLQQAIEFANEASRALCVPGAPEWAADSVISLQQTNFSDLQLENIVLAARLRECSAEYRRYWSDVRESSAIVVAVRDRQGFRNSCSEVLEILQ